MKKPFIAVLSVLLLASCASGPGPHKVYQRGVDVVPYDPPSVYNPTEPANPEYAQCLSAYTACAAQARGYRNYLCSDAFHDCMKGAGFHQTWR